jgi:transposase
MIKRDKKTYANGTVKTQIRVVEAYRPGPGLPPKQRTVKDFGYLEDKEDPKAFMAEVEEFNARYKTEHPPGRIEAPGTEKMYGESNRRLNYGFKFLEAIYTSLDIDGFIKQYEMSHRFRGDYSLSDIFKFLVILRLLSPDSKRATCQLKNNFYNMRTDFTLQDVYRSLDYCADFDTELQRHLNERVKQIIGRDLTYAFYDVTNYFFEIDFPEDDDDIRQKGVSKEHRCDPIAAMGLFMDANGLPVSMSMFPGNTSETTTLRPVMKDVKESYGLGRIIVVADKGLNSSKNIDVIVNNKDGFIFSQVLRGKKGQRYETELFGEDGWIIRSDRYKYKLFDEEYTGHDENGKKVSRKRRILLYWDKADAERARRKREEKLRKAEKALKNNAYAIKHGYEEYTKEEIVDKQSGEYLENVAKVRSVNREKAEKDAKYDGYFCIITSELDMDERDIRRAYKGLWRIEESFRVMKSDLYARPVFVRSNNHIRAHFLTCFVALLVIRILQHKMGERPLSAERIARALATATCRISKNGIVWLDDVGGMIAFQKTLNQKGEIVDTLQFSDKDEIALDYRRIQETFGTDFYDVFPKQEVFNKFLKNITLA